MQRQPPPDKVSSVSKRLLLLLALISILAGCLHAQLNGSIAGATITITELRNPGTVVSRTTTSDEAGSIAFYGEETWASWNAVVQHWLLGIFYVDATLIDTDKLYLVTASGGFETDMNGDLQADDSPTPEARKHAQTRRPKGYKCKPCTLCSFGVIQRIQSKFAAQSFGYIRLVVFQGDTGGIGNAWVAVKRGNDCSRINHRGLTQFCYDLLPRCQCPSVIVRANGLDEFA